MLIHRIECSMAIDKKDGRHRVKTFKEIIGRLNLDKPNRLAVDLGCGPCIFAKHAANHGFRVTAVDGRSKRIPGDLNQYDISFHKQDVRNFPVEGYDLIMMLGLIYHFHIDEQLQFLSRCAYGPPVILDTQVHVPDLVQSPTPQPWETTVLDMGEYTGVEFPEGTNPMAAIGNPKSFWHTEESWLRVFRDAGYRSAAKIDPIFVSKYGGRRFFVLNGL